MDFRVRLGWSTTPEIALLYRSEVSLPIISERIISVTCVKSTNTLAYSLWGCGEYHLTSGMIGF
jgi:hypothetical protein